MIQDVDLGSGRIRVFGKGSKERYAYMSPGTALAIHGYLHKTRPDPRTEDRLFLTVDGYPLTRSRVQAILQYIGRRVGLKQRLSAHRLRHTYATLCLKNGNNLEYVRITLGHSDIKTTSDAYLAASDVDVASACKRCSPLAHMFRSSRAQDRFRRHDASVV
jgi:integrase/recombinase XerD